MTNGGELTQSHSVFEPLPRGVYLAPFTVKGDRYYYAIDGTGDLIAGRMVPTSAEPACAIDELWEALDARPQLRLV